MFVPEMFRLEDRAALAALIRDHNFGLLVTALPGAAPQASHLPFLYDDQAGTPGRLLGHMARANPQWRDFEALAEAGGEALVVFQGPHGYISPSWYGGGPAVPTWNYLAVHAYGRPQVVSDAETVHGLLERMVEEHEAGFATPWRMDSQEPGFLARMQRGIVAFEIELARLEGKAKLSQNKPEAICRKVVEALEAAGDPALAGEMRDKVLNGA